MVQQLYSVYDKKAKLYHPLDGFHNDAHAMRFYIGVFARKGTMMEKYPGDFQVWRIGAFNDENAKVIVLQNPSLLCEAIDLKEEEETRGFTVMEKKDA